MTDKKQIIIHGIDVSKCKFYRPGSFPTDCEINPVNAYCESPTSSNCYFKQLARKTQECEELKLKCLGNRNDYLCERQVTKRYRKALDKIEEYCDKQISLTGDLPFRTTESDILDIINKSKGQEGNE